MDLILPEQQDEERKNKGAVSLVLPERIDPIASVNAYDAAAVNPEAFAKVKRVSDQLGLPVPTVERNFAELDSELKVNAMRERMARDPFYAERMRNPNFAKLSQGDEENLGIVRQSISFLGRAVGQLFVGGPVSIGAQAFDASGVALDLASRGADATGILPNIAATLDKEARNARYMAERARGSAEYFFGAKPNEGNIARGVLSGMQSAGQMLAAAPIASRIALETSVAQASQWLAGAFGAGVGAQAYTQAREAGKNTAQAITYAVPHAAFEYVFEVASARTLLAGMAAKTGVLQFAKELLKKEIPSEQYTTLTQNFNEWMNLNPEKTLKDFLSEVPDAAAQTLVATIVGGSVQAGGIRLAQRAVDRAHRDEDMGREGAEALKTLLDATNASLLKSRHVPTFAELVAAAGGESQVEAVYMNAATFAQSAAESGLDIATAMPETAAALEDAVSTNSDVRIPLAEFAANAELFQPGIVEELKLDPNGATQRELADAKWVEETRQKVEKLLTEHQFTDSWKQSADVVKNTIKQQLVAAGRFTNDVNEAYASFVSGFYSTQAHRIGITPEEMYARYPLRVQATKGSGEAVMDQPGSVNFDRWFAGSKVVDESGKPLVVYHGTQADFAEFDDERQGETVDSQDVGYFFTNFAKEAGKYATFDWGRDAPQPNVMPVYLSMQNPKLLSSGDFEAPGQWYDFYGRDAVTQAMEEGHDGLIVSSSAPSMVMPNGRQIEMYVAFKSTQIKSAIGNNGNFDPNDANILHQVAPQTVAQNAARAYVESRGGVYRPAPKVPRVDAGRAVRIAQAYEEMKHDPQNPEVQAAYKAMIDETLAQWQVIKATGLKVEFIKDGQPDPYAASPRMAIEDVANNNHLWVFPTDQGFGSDNTDVSDNPLLTPTAEVVDGRTLLANDVFRIVHDYFGHIKDNNGFRAAGEENAWRSHAAMYSPLARRAMTSETRGQNSWVNFGPYGEKNRTAKSADTVYATQKTGLLPEWVSEEGSFDATETLNSKPVPEYGRIVPNSVSAVAVHFSPSGSLENLLSSKYGTGMKGAERGRIMASKDARLKQRIHFYLPMGKGVTAEKDVGTHAYVARLNNLYDASADPLNLAGKDLETKVLDAGFDGYMTRDFFGGQGAVVLLGSHSVPVTYFGSEREVNAALANTAPPAPVKSDKRVLAERLIKAEGLPYGQLTPSQWREVLAAKQPDLLADLPASVFLGTEPVYRDQLARTFYQEPGLFNQGEVSSEWYYSELARHIELLNMKQGTGKAWKDAIKGLVAKGVVKPAEVEAVGINEWLDLQDSQLPEAIVFLPDGSELKRHRKTPGNERTAEEKARNQVAELEKLHGKIGYRVELKSKLAKEEVVSFLAKSGVQLEEQLLTENGSEGDEDVEYIEGDWEIDDPGSDYFRERAQERIDEMGDEEKAEAKGVDVSEWTDEYEEALLSDLAEQERRYYYEDSESPQTMIVTVSGNGDNYDYQVSRAYGEVAVYDPFGKLLASGSERRVDIQDSVMEHARENYSEMFSNGSEAAEYSNYDYRLEGRNEDYIELKLILPGARRFRSNHFPDTGSGNIVVHFRADTRKDADGKRVLFIEEVQSDWAQAGRDEGFRDDKKQERLTRLIAKRDALQNNALTLTDAEIALLNQLHDEIDSATPSGAVEPGPFVTNTDAVHTLAWKRIIRYAAENGFDRVAWTRGDQQVERWSGALRKRVDSIEWAKTEQGVHLLGFQNSLDPTKKHYVQGNAIDGFRVFTNGRNAENTDAYPTHEEASDVADKLNARGARKVVDTTYAESALSDAIGKAMGKQILEDPNQSGKIEGGDITIDSVGMAAVYGDENGLRGTGQPAILTKTANAVLKKFGGGKVVAVDMGFDTGKATYTYSGRDYTREEMVAVAKALVAAEPDSRYNRNKANDILSVAAYVDDGTLLQHLNSYPGNDASQLIAFFEGVEVRKDLEAAPKQPGFDMTPELKAKALAGLPLFQGNRGQISFGADVKEQPSVITLLANADLSTFLHETGHFYLEVLADMASQVNAPADIVADFNTVMQWFGIKGDFYHGSGTAGLTAPTAPAYFTSDAEVARGFSEQSGVFDDPIRAQLVVKNTFRPEVDGEKYGIKSSSYLTPENITKLKAAGFDSAEGEMLNGDGTREIVVFDDSQIHVGKTPLEVWHSMTLEEKRPYHEQWARGIEAYLFEGKAPTPNLQSLFGRFRAWLINVYEKISALNVTLTPEVRQVMGRLVAANEEILQAESDFAAIYDTKPEGMTDVEWADYQVLGGAGTQEAVDQLQTRSLRDMQFASNAKSAALKKLQRQAAALRKTVRAEVAAEVEAEPIYRALAWLKTGYLDGEKTTGGKLSIPAMKEMYGDEPAAPWRYLPTNVVSAEGLDGALHPDFVAELFGFSSGDELVRTLLDTEPAREKIDGITDQRMLERHGDLSDPASVERAADAAVHNEVRARFVATELRMLDKATGDRGILMTLAKNFAAEIVARKKIRLIKPGIHSAAEQKAARNAKAAVLAGDTKTAAGEKRNQLVNLYAARASHDAIDEVNKAVSYLKRVGESKTVDPEYREQIQALLERFDLRKVSARDTARRESLVQWIEAQKAKDAEPVIDADLVNEAYRKPYQEMTLEEFRGLVDSVRNIEHLGRLKHKLLVMADKRAFAAVESEAAASIVANAKTTVPELNTSPTFTQRMGHYKREIFAFHTKLSSFMRQFDGWKDNGIMQRLFVQSSNAAGAHEAALHEQASMRLLELMKPLGRMGKRTVVWPGFSPTTENRLMIALNTGTEGNLQRLMDGDHWTPAQVQAVLDTLTKQEMDFVQSVWDFIGEYRDQVGAQQKRLTGVEPRWIEARVVKTKHGDYRGGYIPAKYDGTRSTRSLADEASAALYDQWRAARGSAKTRDSFTKGRAEKVTERALRKDFGVITQHVTEVTHRLAWQEWVVDANRLLRSKKIDSAIKQHYGHEVLESLREAVKDIATGPVGAQNLVESILSHVRTGATVAGLGWKVSTALLQFTGASQSIVRIGPKWFGKGMAQFLGDAVHMESAAAKVAAKSEVMRLRAKTMQREISEIQDQVKGEGSAVKASFFYLIQKAQMLVDVPTWLGAYEKALATSGIPDAEKREANAIAQADQAVKDAQGGGQIHDLPAALRGGPLLKLFTNFASFFVGTTFQLTRESFGRTNFKSPASIALLGIDFLLLYSIPAALGTLMKYALSDDDDEDKLIRNLVADQLSYLTGTMIGLRELAGAGRIAAGLPADYAGPAGLRVLNELYKFTGQVAQGEADEPFWKSLNNSAGILAHYPAGALNNLIDGIVALSNGKTSNPGVLVVGSSQR